MPSTHSVMCHSFSPCEESGSPAPTHPSTPITQVTPPGRDRPVPGTPQTQGTPPVLLQVVEGQK